jgi:neutral ceramidase
MRPSASTPIPRREFLQGSLALGALAAASRAGAAVAADSWQAGVGRVRITPSGPVWMAGYGARTRECDATLQDLWAKALALVDPQGRRAVLLALDSCGMARESADTIARAVERRHGLPREALLINMSHSHCTPFTEGLVRAMRDFSADEWERIVAYTRWLEQQAVAAVDAALATLGPVMLAHGKDSASFAVNRRNNREADVPQLRAEQRLAGPVDHDVPVLTIRRPDGAVRAIVCGYACHTTTLNGYEWNGDYAGFAQEEIEHRHRGATAIFTAGCGGDINPLPRRTVELARDYGRQLADAVDRAMGGSLRPIRGGLHPTFERVSLAFSQVPTRAELQAVLDAAETPKERYERLRAKHLLGELARGVEIAGSYPYPIQCWRLGGLTWLALGGEPVVEYSLRLKEALGTSTWVLGYSHEIMAYIPSERVLQEGGYEGGGAMAVFGLPSRWAPGLEGQITAASIRLTRAPSR